MKLKSLLKKLVFGLTLSQEYICLGLEGTKGIFRSYLTFPNSPDHLEITHHHLFLGYRPLIIGIWQPNLDPLHHKLSTSTEACLSLCYPEFKLTNHWGNYPVDSRSVAHLELELVYKQHLDNHTLFIYQGKKGKHHLLNPFHQLTNQVLNHFRIKRIGNIDLPGNLYDQVRIAYSVPRNISLITIFNSKDRTMNLFPTDLHGPLAAGHYIGSLRHTGKACQQVDKFQKIVISQIHIDQFQQVYAMGRNHMQDLKPENNFELDSIRSEKFDFPLPSGVLRYREMEQIDAYDIHIHRLHFYRIINQKQLKRPGNSLAHIHQYYAEWRQRKGLETQLKLR
ncbi:MAG: hypothetical protein O6848_03395 [Bacteroidetes bacterium]|nr:hypothetical protein [Bacteroidota bacterium]